MHTYTLYSSSLGVPSTTTVHPAVLSQCKTWLWVPHQSAGTCVRRVQFYSHHLASLRPRTQSGRTRRLLGRLRVVAPCRLGYSHTHTHAHEHAHRQPSSAFYAWKALRVVPNVRYSVACDHARGEGIKAQSLELIARRAQRSGGTR